MTNENFNKWNKKFRDNELFDFNNDANALLWLKIRAISKKETMTLFLEKNKITLKSTKIAEQNIELFDSFEKDIDNSMKKLDEFLSDCNNEWYKQKGVDEKQLKEDLYKINTYEWGGDQNNSLDKHLVSRFVKVISKYEELQRKQTEIQANAWNYVRTSWYNNWTSYLIESIFKRHKKVISAVGEIKSVDFFIDNTPFDLKVTYFPNQYMNEKIKVKLDGKTEMSWLKQKAKDAKISIGNPDSVPIIMEKISAAGHDKILDELREKRKNVIEDADKDKTELIKWLYEQQGEMRFGAENRLFVILADSSDMTQSWKMKRAFEQIEPAIKNYLNTFNKDALSEIEFDFKGKKYKTFAGAIIIVK